MSDAKKCDRCGKFFEIEHGCVTLVDIQVTTPRKDADGDHIWQGWTEVDFCLECSKVVLDAVAPALQDVERPA